MFDRKKKHNLLWFKFTVIINRTVFGAFKVWKHF